MRMFNLKIFKKAGQGIIVLIGLLFLLAFAPALYAATYYVDATSGQDTNNGLLQTTPWKTIAKVNASRFNPGDKVLFKKGETWREQLTIPSSGSTGNPIIFGAYGSGALPIINGSGTSYCINVKGKSYITIQGLSLMNANQYGVFLTPPAPTTVQGITIQGCNISYASKSGIHYNSASSSFTRNLITGNTIHHNGASGVELDAAATNNTVSNNIVYQNSQIYIPGGANDNSSGIHFWTVGTGNVVTKNQVYKNGYLDNGTLVSASAQIGGGIWFDTVASGNVVSYNLVYDNSFQGVYFENDSGCQIYYNIIYGQTNAANYSAGINISSYSQQAPSSGNSIYSNVSYGNNWGISLSGYADGAAGMFTKNIFKNNIVTGSTGGYELYAQNGAENDGTMGSGNVYTYNDFGLQATNFIYWGKKIRNLSTYSAWETATGMCGSVLCSRSVEADPLFVSTSTPDFHLQSTSPCINAGTEVGLSQDYEGNYISGAPDLGAYEYTGNSSPPTRLRIIN